MGLLQTIREEMNARRERRKLEKREKTARQIVPLLKEHDFRGIREMLETHKEDIPLVERLTEYMKGYDLINSSSEAASKDAMAMMESLKDTAYGKWAGSRLSAVPTEEARPLHHLIAMHTFLLDVHIRKHPEERLPSPDWDEQCSAKRILGSTRAEEDKAELFQLAVHFKEPSEYVKHRYDLTGAYEELAEAIDKSLPVMEMSKEDLYYWDMEIGWAIDSILARGKFSLEKNFSGQLPEQYLTLMESDRYSTLQFIQNPEKELTTNFFAQCNHIRWDESDTKKEVVERAVRRFEQLDRLITEERKSESLIKDNRSIDDPLFEAALENHDYGRMAWLVGMNSDNVQRISEWTSRLVEKDYFFSNRETGAPFAESLMKTLKETVYAKQAGLQPKGENGKVLPLHLLVAGHTVLRHAFMARKENANGMPALQEADRAMKVLDGVRKDKDLHELQRTATKGTEPSDYVKIRYGLMPFYEINRELSDQYAEEVRGDNYSSMHTIIEEERKINKTIRQTADEQAKMLLRGKTIDTPWVMLAKDMEKLNLMAAGKWEDVALSDRSFLMRYRLKEGFDDIRNLMKGQTTDEFIRNHLPQVLQARTKLLQNWAANESGKIEKLLSRMEGKPIASNKGMKQDTSGSIAREEPQPSKRNKLTI